MYNGNRQYFSSPHALLDRELLRQFVNQDSQSFSFVIRQSDVVVDGERLRECRQRGGSVTLEIIHMSNYISDGLVQTGPTSHFPKTIKESANILLDCKKLN